MTEEDRKALEEKIKQLELEKEERLKYEKFQIKKNQSLEKLFKTLGKETNNEMDLLTIENKANIKISSLLKPIVVQIEME